MSQNLQTLASMETSRPRQLRFNSVCLHVCVRVCVHVCMCSLMQLSEVISTNGSLCCAHLESITVSWQHTGAHTLHSELIAHTHTQDYGCIGITSKSKSVGLWNQARGQIHERFTAVRRVGTKET